MKDAALLEQGRGARHGRGAAWEGNGMDAAWARHTICESAFSLPHCNGLDNFIAWKGKVSWLRKSCVLV